MQNAHPHPSILEKNLNAKKKKTFRELVNKILTFYHISAFYRENASYRVM